MNISENYCANCGAANTITSSACFACGTPLTPGSTGASTTSPLANEPLLHKRYRLLNLVGQGGFASVYRAEDTHTREIVAIKAIGLASLTAEQIIDATDTYNREVRFGRALAHAKLPRFYDSFTDRDHWYLVVEFIDGVTLEKYVEQKPAHRLSLWEVLNIGIQVCDVLDYLHRQNPPVIFRDIKPDNIMLDGSGQVHLIDFGIARHFRPGQQRDTQQLGSPGYAAPEQYGLAQTSERSDIYSLGATLQMLLTGSNPLDNSQIDTSIAPQSMLTLLERMQAKRPEDRPANAREVRTALETIARDRGLGHLMSALQPPRARWTYGNALGSTQAAAYLTHQPFAPGQQVSAQGRPLMPRSGTAGSIKQLASRKGTRAWLSVLGSAGMIILCLYACTVWPFAAEHDVKDRTSGVQMPGMAGIDKQVLTIGLIDKRLSTGLDPIASQDTQDEQIENLLYAGLTTLDSHNKIVPDLAQSWDIRPDPSATNFSWTFYLRPNLSFSDGSPLTSSDIAYSIDRVFSTDSHFKYLAHYFKGGEARLRGQTPTLVGYSLFMPDALTLTIETQGRVAFLPALMSMPCFKIINKKLLERYHNSFVLHLEEGGTSGPFRQSGVKSVSSQSLVPNSFYYGGKPNALTKIVVKQYLDKNEAYKDFEAGTLSVLHAPHLLATTPSDMRTRMQTGLVGKLDYLAFNYLTKPFNNVKIRKAFALALDKSVFLYHADNSYEAEREITNHLILNGQPGYNESLSREGSVLYSPGQANDLLRSGMREEGIETLAQFPPITLTYSSQQNPDLRVEMPLVRQQWKEALGIDVRLDDRDSKSLRDRIQGSVNNPDGLQMWLDTWSVDYPDPYNWITLPFGKDSTWNAANFGQNTSSSSAAQQQLQRDLLEKDDTSGPQEERFKLYQQAEQELIDEVAWIPIAQHTYNVLVASNVRGYNMNGVGTLAPETIREVYIAA